MHKQYERVFSVRRSPPSLHDSCQVATPLQPVVTRFCPWIIVMHRLCNPNSGSRHYTTSEVERNHLVSIGWQCEDFGWYGVR